MALAVAAEKNENLVFAITDHPRVHPGRRLLVGCKLPPIPIAERVRPGASVADDTPAWPFFGHVAAAEQHQFIVNGIVGQRTPYHRRRRMSRRQVCPAPVWTS